MVSLGTMKDMMPHQASIVYMILRIFVPNYSIFD